MGKEGKVTTGGCSEVDKIMNPVLLPPVLLCCLEDEH